MEILEKYKKNIGKNGVLKIKKADKLSFGVKIIDVSVRGGNYMYLITPLQGGGEQWFFTRKIKI